VVVIGIPVNAAGAHSGGFFNILSYIWAEIKLLLDE
jgi:hypothetical protein